MYNLLINACLILPRLEWCAYYGRVTNQKRYMLVYFRCPALLHLYFCDLFGMYVATPRRIYCQFTFEVSFSGHCVFVATGA